MVPGKNNTSCYNNTTIPCINSTTCYPHFSTTNTPISHSYNTFLHTQITTIKELENEQRR